MAQADYIKGVVCGADELMSVILGWLESGDNAGGRFTRVQDFVDTGTTMNGDGERCVILRGDIPGELPVYIGMRTFRGFEGMNQHGIQFNAYTNFDPDLPWDCQAGSLARPERYVAASHFYEGCPAMLVGAENICYWLVNDGKHIRGIIRTPTVPVSDSDMGIRTSVVYEGFYLGWLRRLVSKEGYPYPMTCIGTTYTLGNASVGYVRRNTAYGHAFGSIRHLPPFHHDYMMYEGIQPSVVITKTTQPPGYQASNPFVPVLGYQYRWPSPLSVANVNGTPTNYCARTVSTVSFLDGGSYACGPTMSLCTTCTDSTDIRTKTSTSGDGLVIHKYDIVTLSNRGLYFDGTWGWTMTYPIRNAFIKSRCWCTRRITPCGSHNAFGDIGEIPPITVFGQGIAHDQLAAHFGWLPEKIVESLSGHRLMIPVYVAIVGSIADMQSKARDEFGTASYDEEQRRIQIAGIMEGFFLVPGLGLSAQDILKITEGGKTIQYLVVPDVYRYGAFNFCAIRLGVKEWHEENPAGTTPTA